MSTFCLEVSMKQLPAAPLARPLGKNACVHHHPFTFYGGDLPHMQHGFAPLRIRLAFTHGHVREPSLQSTQPHARRRAITSKRRTQHGNSTRGFERTTPT